MRKAVVDVGSNSVLLVVSEQVNGAWNQLFESSVVSALGVGVKETGVLGETGMRETLTALRDAFQKSNELGAGAPVAAATMAARIATNTSEFLKRAEAQGTPVVVLPGEDEAELGFLAVANDPTFAAHPRLSIVDVGGQSTEIVTADRTEHGWNTLFRRSYPIGTLALRGSTLPHEASGPGEILSASARIDDVFGFSHRPDEGGYAIVLGATGTNLVSIRDGLTSWQPEKVHGAWLGYDEVSRAVERMMPMTDAERGAIVGMEPGREKTIHIGALILERGLHALKVHGCAVSVRGWRHALLEHGWPGHAH